ncbi:MAG: hypothetical protein CSA11_05385 [Chloroflexi bacterium]|nr:MAG: hypothetical protein CSB13_01215 [Chloroflexota bacterium]PIE81205.1 MAG: hypothetical protein CSA11_05385 [Chloroflexota bacterium]
MRKNGILILTLLIILMVTACGGEQPYEETFDEPGNWRTGNDAGAVGQVVDGVYDMLVEADDATIWTTAGQSFADGVYQVEATQVSGPDNNGYGMVFRLDDDKDDFYTFKISGDGYVWIGRYHGGGTEVEPLISDHWFESPAVNKGADRTNVLRVNAEGGNMIFYVNDQEVGRVTDNTFSKGDIGLLVDTLGFGGVQIQFDNFTVTPLVRD